MGLPAAFSVAEGIEEAFERIGRAPSGLGAEHLISARRSIRLLLSDWNTDGVDFWKVASLQLHTLALNESYFTPVSGTIDILDCAVRRNNFDTPMLIVSQTDWFAIPDKTITGMPNRLWLERLATSKIAHIWPASANATDIIVYNAMVRFNDSSVLSSEADVPDMWLEAFYAGLAFKLAEKFAPERLAEKEQLYGGPLKNYGAYYRARIGDRERSDTTMVVHHSRRFRR